MCFLMFYQLLNIDNGYMSLLADSGDIREDLRVPDTDVGKEIDTKFSAGEEFLVSMERHWEAGDASQVENTAKPKMAMLNKE